MSTYGSLAIIAVLILRKCFAKLPKRISALFWIAAGLRLLCPVNIGTALSPMNLFGKANEAPAPVRTEAVRQTVNALALQGAKKTAAVAAQPVVHAATMDWKALIPIIWLAGIAIAFIYLTVKTIRLHAMLRKAKRQPDGSYYESDAIDTSFVLGIMRPRIYMQTGLSEQEKAYVLLHEKTHIEKADHITRLIGVLTLCLHWFNPIVWIGFAEMCSDLEMRCDEAVIDKMGNGIKRSYCRSIVELALDRESVHSGLYAAFAGDNYSGKEIKKRVKNIIDYKQISRIAGAIIIVFALGIAIVLSSKAMDKEEQDAGPATVKEEREQLAVMNAGNAEETVQTIDAEDDEEEPVGHPVGDPNVTSLDLTEEECIETYGLQGKEIPDDVIYSDEGRPFSKTWDYRQDPVLSKMAARLEKEGWTLLSPDEEYLDQDGNVQTGRELYRFAAEIGEYNLVNVLRVSEEYANESFDSPEIRDGIWYASIGSVEDGWIMERMYDPESGVMIYFDGDEAVDWEALGLFDAIR
ncbi:MAG: hypothetical protein K6E50_09195 [Lachnospiraceae bacterium]|nr:hypothetical protein [Lachnospiraceae bacterium]